MVLKSVLFTTISAFATVIIAGCLPGCPQLSITESPAYGDKEGIVRGRVDNAEGYNYWDLGITTHIKVNEMWWGKPFEDRLLTPLNPDFTFAVDVTTGGADENATEILVGLVSAKYAPSVNTPPSPDEYFDRVLITRQPTEGTTPPGEEIDLSFLDKLGAQKWINFAPTYFDPTRGQYPTEAQLREALQKIHDLDFTGVFFYESGQSGNVMKHAPRIAKEVGFEVIGVAIWNPLDAAEVQNAIDAKADATFYIVGSEGLLRGKEEDYKKDELKPVLLKMRQETGRAVTTAEPVSIWLENLDLVESVDFVSANIYGFWEGQREPQAAVDFLLERYNALKAKAGTKKVIVRETGFPTGGHPDGSVAKQRDYFERLGKSGVPFVHFEAFDQLWKHEYLDGYDIGIHWGILDKDGRAKTDNHAPVAQDVTMSTPFQTPVTVTLVATDEDNDPLSYETSSPLHGNLSGPAPNLTYTPDAGFTGDDSFTYTASDGKAKSNVATVTVHVGQAQNPTIEFTYVPPKGSFDNLRGKCTNVDYVQYRVVVYIKVDSTWWVKPYQNNPLTIIQPDGTWVCDITTGGHDELATEIRAFVVVKTYQAALNQLPNEGDYITSCAATR